MSCDVLAFGPHPDDVELFVGGAMIRFVDLGHSTGVVDLSRGECATHGSPEARAEEAEAAAKILGLTFRDNLGLPDTGLDAGSPEQLRALVEVIRRRRPELVLAPWPCAEERHPDHLATGQLVEKAVFDAGVGKFAAGGEPIRPRLLQYQLRHHMPASFVMDTSAAAERKLEAIRCHRSQLAQPGTLVGSSVALAAIEARDRHVGSLIGASHGEAFRSPATLSIGDPLRHLREHPGVAHAFQPVRA